MLYELNYLVGESREADLEKIKKEVADIVAGEEAKFIEPQIAEKRKLAYKVEKDIKGIYIAQRFEVEQGEMDAEKPDIISRLTRKLNLNQNIFRFLIVKADDLPELKSREQRAKEQVRIQEKPAAKREPVKTVKKEKVKTETDIDEKLDELLNI
jgi:ribosomal protein S6